MWHFPLRCSRRQARHIQALDSSQVPRVFNVSFLAGNLPGFFVPPHLRALKLNRQSYKPLYIIIPLYMSYSKPQLVRWELDQLDQLDRGAACGN